MIHSVWDKVKGHPHVAQGTAYAILFTMGTCHLLNDMIQSVIPALYPLLKDTFGFTFAQIGVITVAVFGVRATESLIDNSKQKEEFADIILPVLMFDPVPFEDPNEMGELALLRSSIWSAVISNNDKYSIGRR